jgi:hypothetical protein
LTDESDPLPGNRESIPRCPVYRQLHNAWRRYPEQSCSAGC